MSSFQLTQDFFQIFLLLLLTFLYAILSFSGFRYPNLVLFLSGVFLAGSNATWIMSHHVVSTGVLVLFGGFCAVIGGTLALLLDWLVLGGAFGYAVSLVVFVIDRGQLYDMFGTRVGIYFALSALGALIAYYYQV